MMGSLRSLRIPGSSEKCPVNSRYNYLDHCCHYVHLNKFLDVWLEIKIVLWNVVLRAMRNVHPGKEKHPAGEDFRACRLMTFQNAERGTVVAPFHFPQLKSDPPLSCIRVIDRILCCDYSRQYYQK